VCRGKGNQLKSLRIPPQTRHFEYEHETKMGMWVEKEKEKRKVHVELNSMTYIESINL
jgi:hypothetical protein